MASTALSLKANLHPLLSSKRRCNFHGFLYRTNFISCSNFTSLQVKSFSSTSTSFNNESSTSKQDRACAEGNAVTNRSSKTTFNWLKKLPAIMMVRIFMIIITMIHGNMALGRGGGFVMSFSSGPVYIDTCHDNIKLKNKSMEAVHPRRQRESEVVSNGLTIKEETWALLAMAYRYFGIILSLSVLLAGPPRKNRYTVIKLQVGLYLGEEDFDYPLFERGLNEVAQNYFTLESHYLFKAALRKLYERFQYWVAVYSSMKLCESWADVESYLNGCLIEECFNGGSETLINLDDMNHVFHPEVPRRDTHMVVTVLAIATNQEKIYLPRRIASEKQLMWVLEKLYSIAQTTSVLETKVMWNPSEIDDVKSFEELHKKYPQLCRISEYCKSKTIPLNI